jgi:FkbM family methyltransferase
MTAATPDTTEGVIRFTAEPRSPFVVKHLPLLAWLYYLAYRPWRRVQRYFIAKPALTAYQWLRGAGLGGIGIATINIGGQTHELYFDSRNTQFHALYLPQFLPCYEPETTALIDLLVGEHDVFFDVGANWGWFALTLASRKGFVVTVHAFEPVSSSFADLMSLVNQAGLAERIICHQLALGNCDGEALMSLPDGVHSGLAKMADGGNLRVRLARLDTLGLPSPNVIKLDVEQHECEVLHGARATIAKGRPFLIFENWAHADRPEITSAPLELLVSWGYRLFFPA